MDWQAEAFSGLLKDTDLHFVLKNFELLKIWSVTLFQDCPKKSVV